MKPSESRCNATGPVRIQLLRKKGWRMPENTVSVARPTMWGNPYWDVRRYGLDLCLEAFRNTATGYWTPGIVPDGHPYRNAWLDWLYHDHTTWLERIQKFYGHPAEAARLALRGKNLACWCPILIGGRYTPCHADVLLALANDLSMEDVRDENIRRAKGEAL